MDSHQGYLVDPKQAEIVKRIYQEYLDGYSMDKMADGILPGTGRTGAQASAQMDAKAATAVITAFRSSSFAASVTKCCGAFTGTFTGANQLYYDAKAACKTQASLAEPEQLMRCYYKTLS